MEVEAQNFEGVAQSKLSHDRHEKIENIVWDYFMSIVGRYVLDDLSQVLWLLIYCGYFNLLARIYLSLVPLLVS
jgi:hypothetical protein